MIKWSRLSSKLSLPTSKIDQLPHLSTVLHNIGECCGPESSVSYRCPANKVLLQIMLQTLPLCPDVERMPSDEQRYPLDVSIYCPSNLPIPLLSLCLRFPFSKQRSRLGMERTPVNKNAEKYEVRSTILTISRATCAAFSTSTVSLPP